MNNGRVQPVASPKDKALENINGRTQVSMAEGVGNSAAHVIDAGAAAQASSSDAVGRSTAHVLQASLGTQSQEVIMAMIKWGGVIVASVSGGALILAAVAVAVAS